MTRSRPPCSQTKSRPSGANCIAVGLESPLATSVSVNPEGTVAARASDPRRLMTATTVRREQNR